MPPFLENLYRDMRDRRLLLPAAALLVALIAVPVLLGSSSSSPPAPASASPSVAQADSATDPAVLAEQAGVTNYRKRLDSLQSKDPFTARGQAAPKTSSSGSGGGSSATSTSTSSGSSALGTVNSDTSVSISGTSGSTASTPTTTSSGSTSGSGDSGGTSTPKNPKPRFYAFRVSVAVGPAGNLRERNSVKRLVFLPGDNRPLVAFAGVTEDSKRAVFVVSHDVSSVRGDGKCVPRRSACNYLELRPGDKASLDYAPQHDRRFNLKLRDIKLVPASKPQATSSGKAGTMPVLGPDGLAGLGSASARPLRR